MCAYEGACFFHSTVCQIFVMGAFCAAFTSVSSFWESYARQVILTGGRTPSCFGAASCQHGDLGAEVVAAANRWVLVFGV